METMPENWLKRVVRSVVDPRLRDSIWAYRERQDTAVLDGVLRGMFQVLYPAGSNQEHLAAVMDWLCAAQDASPLGGVAAFYDVRQGNWSPLYPETTGYIIPTFYDFAVFKQDDSYRVRAYRMAEWLLTLQLDSGAFPIGPLWPDWERTPIVFDTGQIMFGLLRAYQETGEERFLASAQRAGDWLAHIQDPDGCWRKNTSLGYVHTYNVRAAWAVLLLAGVSGQAVYRDVAVRNLRWAISQQDADGWYRNAAFSPKEDPLTHTIAYTVEGILESGIVLSDDAMLASARLAADRMRLLQEEDGFLRARYGPGWKSNLSWSCLTGTAQMGMVWLRLYSVTQDAGYLSAARSANTYVKQRQPRNSRSPGVAGGIAGSYPIYAGYEPYRNLNWAAKFFADSLMLDERYAGSVR